ncbi:hypothetical protein PTKIN_Ptkin11bG0146100 [Pterospermum kingtungense]
MIDDSTAQMKPGGSREFSLCGRERNVTAFKKRKAIWRRTSGEEPKRQKVKDEGDSGDDATCNIGIFLQKDFFNGNGLGADNPAPDEGQAIRGLCSYFISDGPHGSLRDDVGHLTAEVEDTVLVLCKSLMRFFSDRDPCYDHILPPHQVQARIKDFLQSLHGNASPDDSISYVSGSRESPGDSMSYLPHFPDSSARGVDGGIFKAAEAFIRVWKFMDMCLDIPLDDNGPMTIQGHFSEFSLLYNDVAALLRCSPYSLGINKYGGGMVAGLISIVKADPAKDQYNICGSCRYLIPDDLERVATLHLHPIGAKNIIVVEQEEVFEELAVNHVFERTRNIIISSLGYPDTATRFFLHKLSSLYPDLPVLALVDWSPVGLDILYTYKVLSIGP